MIKPDMPNIPGMGTMTETLDLMKNFWGGAGMPGMNMPGMAMPSLSVEEINKKIADLKAVESWLALNMNMLRSTIQALEVQSATISTLQTMGQTFASSMNPTQAPQPPKPHQPQQPRTGAGEARPEGGAGAAPARGRRKSQGAPQPTSEDQDEAAKLTAPLVNATAWWNMLQDQFKQAVAGAMAGDGSTQPASGGKKDAAPKPAAASSSGNGSQPARPAARKRKSS